MNDSGIDSINGESKTVVDVTRLNAPSLIPRTTLRRMQTYPAMYSLTRNVAKWGCPKSRSYSPVIRVNQVVHLSLLHPSMHERNITGTPGAVMDRENRLLNHAPYAQTCDR